MRLSTPFAVNSPTPVSTRAISHFLREPARATRRHLSRHRQYLRRLDDLRNCPQSRAVLRRYVSGIDIPRLEALKGLLSADTRSRIIAGFHFGDYIFGLNYLCQQIARQQRPYCLSLETPTEVCFANLRRAFGHGGAKPQQFLLAEETSTATLSKILRSADSDLILFVDLPPGFGQTGPVKLLGREACFGRGAATLAVVNRVPVLPVICVQGPNGMSLLVGRQLEPEHSEDDDRAQSIRRINTALARFLEFQLSSSPWLWRYLSLLPDYFQAVAPGQIYQQNPDQEND